MKKNVLVCLLLCGMGFSQPQEWLARFRISETELGRMDQLGMYKVTYDEISQVVGGSISGVPIERLSLWATVADTLNEILDTVVAPFQNLVETPLKLTDANGNGLFDTGDAIEFFGTPPQNWRQVPATLQGAVAPEHYFTYSPFSNYREYHLGMSSSTGLRFSNSLSGSGGASVDKIRRYQRVEKDSILVDLFFARIGIVELESGREWSWKMAREGTEVTRSQSDFGWADLHLPTSADSAWLQIEYQAYRDRYGGSNDVQEKGYFVRMNHLALGLSYNGNSLGKEVACQPGGCAWELGNTNLNSAQWTVSEADGLVRGSERQLEGLTISYLSSPSQFADEWMLLPYNASHTSRIQMSGLNERYVRLVNDIPTHYLENPGVLSDSAGEGEIVKYFAIKDHRNLSPEILPVSLKFNQVISDLVTGSTPSGVSKDYEYLIVAPEAFQEKAIELAEWRNQHSYDPIRTGVVLLEDLFKVMGGNFDPAAIRNYLAFAKATHSPRLKYALLLGDGSFDYRGIEYKGSANWIPPFEDYDFGSDDYYAYLSPGAKLFWEGRSQVAVNPDISVGRIPAKSVEELSLYINKIKLYESKNEGDFGPWRNRALFLADDFQQINNVDGIDHVGMVSRTIDAIHQERPDVQINRIFLLDYDLDLSYKKPAAKRDLIRSLNDGAVVTVYFGHGGSEVIADEHLFDKAAVASLSNRGRYTFFSAFSCTVGKWDAASITPLSEAFVMSGDNGAIASLSATRESLANSNEALANFFYHTLHQGVDSVRLGDALRLAKSSFSNAIGRRINAQRYNLLGEPVLKFYPPQLKLSLDHLPDTLQALDKIEISGTVEGLSEGELYLTLREQDILRTWKDTIQSTPMSTSADVSGRVIYSEVLPFANGRFTTEFISPRKISFGDTNAVIWGYAWGGGSKDYGSFFKDGLSIDGTSTYADSIQDTEAPEITFTPCAEWGEVKPLASGVELSLPLCIEVEVNDSTGLDYIENPDEGINWELVGFNSPQHPLFLEQSGKRAVFRVSLNEDTPLGDYVLKVSARDILEQQGTKELHFHLQGILEAGIQSVYNQPNPMKNKTVFHFQSGSSGMIDAEVRIFSQSGKLLRVLKNVLPGETVWDGTDRWGNRLANGLYYYRVLARHQHRNEWSGKTTEKTFSKLQKLVIAR